MVIDGSDARRSPTEAFCGNMPPADFRSSTNIVTLHFFSQHSDEIMKDSGFEMFYMEVPEEAISEETGTSTTVAPTVPTTTSTTRQVTKQHSSYNNVFAIDRCSTRVFVLMADEKDGLDSNWKRIASPNFQSASRKSYPANDTCFWKLISPDDTYVIEMSLELMDFSGNEESSICHGFDGTSDILSVLDGPDETAPLLKTFCGNQRNLSPMDASLISSSNQAFVVFRSAMVDEIVGKAGFVLAYRAIPKGNLKPMAVAQYPVEKSTKKTPITTTFASKVDLEMSTTLEPPVEPQTTPVDESGLLRCEGRLQILSQEMGVISSPNYGEDSGYLPGDSCLWEIIGRSGSRVELHFRDFDVGTEPAENILGSDADRCATDRVVVYDGPGEYYPVLRALCGHFRGGTRLQTSSNSAFVQFTASPTNSSRPRHAGFLLNYAIVPNQPSPLREEQNFAMQSTVPHQIFAEERTPNVAPMLFDAVKKPDELVANHIQKGRTMPDQPRNSWWCDDDLISMLPDSTISGSSANGEHNASLVRERPSWLNPEAPCCWQPEDSDEHPFVEFNFGGPHIISAARISDSALKPTELLFLLVTESFETRSDVRIPLTASNTKINIKPPVVASKVRIYAIRPRNDDNSQVLPFTDDERPLINIALFGCSSSLMTLGPAELI